MVYGTYNYTYWCLKTNKHTWGGPTLQFPSMEGLQDLRRLSRSEKKNEEILWDDPWCPSSFVSPS
jgi:hypothetical protein